MTADKVDLETADVKSEQQEQVAAVTASLVKGVSDRLGLRGRSCGYFSSAANSKRDRQDHRDTDRHDERGEDPVIRTEQILRKGNITSCPLVAAPVISPTQVVRTRSGAN